MSASDQGSWTLQLTLIAEAPPPAEHEGRPTEFGLVGKKGTVDPGQEQPDGSVQFDFEVQVQIALTEPRFRFRGEQVQGKPDEPFVYLGWRYAEAPSEWIRRQKISLATIPWKHAEPASRQSPLCFEARVPSIMVRTASVAVEWVPRSAPGS
jgi:hypothetical protein